MLKVNSAEWFLILLNNMKRKFYIGFVNILEDDKPQTDNPKAAALKLQNELKDYIYEEDGKIKCMVVKKK